MPARQTHRGEEAPSAAPSAAEDNLADPLQDDLASSTGGLPNPVRGTMEEAFGADFSGVGVHQDGAADALGADAFAQGEDLHFASGAYSPDTSSGRELIGHEETRWCSRSG